MASSGNYNLGENKMKLRRLIICIAALMAVLTVFGACSDLAVYNPDPSQTFGGEGGSDISSEIATEQFTAQAPKFTSEDKLIALTFDDGPRASTTGRILDILEKNNSTATFFLVGYNIENNAETIKRAHEMGCEIANHSNSHENLMKCTEAEIREQVDTPNEVLRAMTGENVALFRAPGGNYKGVEQQIGMPLIQWSIDTEDWKFKDAAHKNRTAEQREADLNRIAEYVFDCAEKGDIILMHDIYDFTADLCEIIIPGLVERGFILTTVSEMYEAYGKELSGGKVYYGVTFNDFVQVLASGAYLVKTNGGDLNIRAEADADSQSLAKIPNGTVITVSKAVAGWAYVSYNSVSGWVNAAYLSKL